MPIDGPYDLDDERPLEPRDHGLKVPTRRDHGRLAERARIEAWSHEEYLVACLQREIPAREAPGAEGRIRVATTDHLGGKVAARSPFQAAPVHAVKRRRDGAPLLDRVARNGSDGTGAPNAG